MTTLDPSTREWNIREFKKNMELKAKKVGDEDGDGERGERWVRFLPPHLDGGEQQGRGEIP